MIDSERHNSQVDQTRLQSLYSLKLFIDNFESYDKIATYANVLDSVVGRSEQLDVFITRKLALGMDLAIKSEEDMAQVISDLQDHINLIEQTISARKLDEPVIQVGKLRQELDKICVNVLEGYTNAVRGYCSSVHTINMMTDSRLDLLDTEQISIVEQTFVTVFKQLDKLRQACTDASKLYSSSTVMGKAFGQFANFSYSLFNALMIAPKDLAQEVESLKNFNMIFKQMEAIFSKIQHEVGVAKNETSLARHIKDFHDLYLNLQTEYNAVNGSADQLKRLFVEINMDELVDAFDYMTMIKEVTTAFNKILEERVRSGYADPTYYKELDDTLEDKPEIMADLGSNFRANFS